MNEWISVKDRLPEITEGLSTSRAVIVWQPEYKNEFCANWNNRHWQIFGAFGRIVEGITHWQPLPAPPEQQKESL